MSILSFHIGPQSGQYNPTVRTLQSHCPYITIPLSGLRTFNYKQSLNEYTTHNKCPNYNTGLQIRIGFQIRVFSHFSSFFFHETSEKFGGKNEKMNREISS
uniref:Uncharacterized protein n=1 Tax=Cacopsylla melanoneura TaxID=428564 RepID=A0A8D8VXL3_9HEMI